MLKKIVWALKHVVEEVDSGCHLDSLIVGDFVRMEVLVEHFSVKAIGTINTGVDDNERISLTAMCQSNA